MPGYTMQDGLGVAGRAASDIETWLKTRPETTNVTNVEADPAYQKKDIDLIWETQKQTWNVEIKGDRLGDQTGNFFFETESNKAKGTLGCFLYSEADLFFYYFVRTGKLYILPLPETRAWFLEHQDEFRERETKTPVGREFYTTVGRLVPVARVIAEVAGVWHERIAAPQAKPFLKWAGGKRQLLKQFDQHLPPELTGNSKHAITRYVEPFLGSGALFFSLVRKFEIPDLQINDANPELVLVYQSIQQRVADVVEQLAQIEAKYHALDPHEQENFYYDIREAFNAALAVTDFSQINAAAAVRAAHFIFLNRTCYNGLYRVNASGKFNVPFGRYKKPRILDEENLQNVAAVLQGVAITCGDFDACQDVVDERTFVYFDPPYRPISKTASFNSYAAGGFDDAAQARLAAFYRQLSERGAKLMLSNSDPHNEDPGDDYFERLYAGFHLHKVSATRMINSDAKKRGKVTELLITNY